MSLANWNKNNILRFSIDYTKVDEDLYNFPVLLNLTEESGQNDFDCSDVFEELKPFQGEVTDKPPIAHWTFDDIIGSTVKDEKGNYNGTLHNMTQTSGGKFDKYLAGGDVSSTLRNVEFSTDIPFKSISVWARRIDISKVSVLITNKDSSYNLLGIADNSDGNYIFFYVSNKVYTNLVINDTEWHNIVIVEGTDNDNHWVFLDGVKCSTSINSEFGGTFKYLGRRDTYTSEVVDFDNVQVFDYKLSDNEIQKLYEAGLNKCKRIAVVYPSVQEHAVPISTSNLLIHSDSYDTDTNITDSSTHKNTILLFGSTQHSITYSKFGNTSIYFNKSNSSNIEINAENNNNVHFSVSASVNVKGAVDFTLDCWVFKLSGEELYIYSLGAPGGGKGSVQKNRGGIRLNIGGTDNIIYLTAGNLSADGSSGWMSYKTNNTINDNEWTHVALTSKDNIPYIFINGVKQTLVINNTTYHGANTFSTCQLYVPRHVNIGSRVAYNGTVDTTMAEGSAEFYTQYIDEYRIIIGEAAWTDDFNPPTSPYKSTKSEIATYVHGEQEQLFCEIERWDYNDKSAQLWVKVPVVLSNQPTDVYLYYDREQDDNDYYIGYTSSTPAQKVWDDNYVGVWHLSQDPSGGTGSILDSTSNENHGTPGGSMTSSDLVDSIVGKGLDFDGSNDYINCGNKGVLDITDNLTLECTFNSDIKMDSNLTSSIGLISHQRSSTDSYSYIINGDGKLHIGTQGGNIQSSKNSWAKNIYFYTAGTYQSSDLSGNLYIDGEIETLSVDSYDSMAGADNELWIGLHGSSGYFNGVISEARLSKTVRSSVWLKVTYYNNYDNICKTSKSNIYLFTGYVTELGSPVQRTVYLYDRASGELIDKTVSDEKGYYLLKSPYNTEHNIVCLDAEAEPDFNDLIISKVKPNGVI